MNKDNLKKLAAYLMGTDLKAKFSMSSFADPESDNITCGSVGCAIGHATLLGPEYHKEVDESWSTYSSRILGLHDYEDGAEWDWCFSSNWIDADNTAKGAGQRILLLLESGVPDVFSNYDMTDEPQFSSLIPLYDKITL